MRTVYFKIKYPFIRTILSRVHIIYLLLGSISPLYITLLFIFYLYFIRYSVRFTIYNNDNIRSILDSILYTGCSKNISRVLEVKYIEVIQSLFLPYKSTYYNIVFSDYIKNRILLLLYVFFPLRTPLSQDLKTPIGKCVIFQGCYLSENSYSVLTIRNYRKSDEKL